MVVVDGDRYGEDDVIAAIDAGAEDVQEDGDLLKVIADPGSLSAVREALEAAGVEIQSADIAMEPTSTVEVGEGEAGSCCDCSTRSRSTTTSTRSTPTSTSPRRCSSGPPPERRLRLRLVLVLVLRPLAGLVVAGAPVAGAGLVAGVGVGGVELGLDDAELVRDLRGAARGTGIASSGRARSR